jgi:CRP-like cAMP-binding protein
VRAGRTFAWQGEAVDRCLLVLSGRLEPTKFRSGAPPLTLGALGPGDWAVLAEMVAGAPALADYAAADESAGLAFNAYNLEALRRRPAVERWLALALARSALALHAQLAAGGPRERIVSWLLGRRRSLAGRDSAAVSATQAEIARCLGLSRETVNKRLAELEARGLVATERGAVGVPDWAALEAALQDD